MCRQSWAPLMKLLQSQQRKEVAQGRAGRRYRSSIGTGIQPLPAIDQDRNQSGNHWGAWSQNRAKVHLRESDEDGQLGVTDDRPNMLSPLTAGGRKWISAHVNLRDFFTMEHTGLYHLTSDLQNIIDMFPLSWVTASSLEPQIFHLNAGWDRKPEPSCFRQVHMSSILPFQAVSGALLFEKVNYIWIRFGLYYVNLFCSTLQLFKLRYIMAACSFMIYDFLFIYIF